MTTPLPPARDHDRNDDDASEAAVVWGRRIGRALAVLAAIALLAQLFGYRWF